jgi:hypothetical protein
LKPSGKGCARFIGPLVLLSVLLPASSLFSQEQSQGKFEIDLSELQKEIDKVATTPFSLGGFLEYQPTIFGIDRDSALSRIRFFGQQGRGNAFDQYSFRLRQEGSYRWSIFSAFLKSDTQVRNDFEGWDEDTKLFEGYFSVKPSASFIAEAGKKVVKWGKGYAWNPVGFIDRPKNPEDPEEALEGITVATTDYIRSFYGPVNTLTLTTALIPVYRYVNAKFGALNNVNFAAKLYLLAYDTDVDFMVFTGSSRTTRYGFDFSRNIAANLEVHGEFAVVNNFKLTAIDANGRSTVTRTEALSYLLGLRYLSERETTYILEYYRNGTGFSREQMKDFFSFVDRSYTDYVTTGNATGMVRASQFAQGAAGMPNPGRNYLYFRASQKEPFDILYLTPAVTAIVNLDDASLALIPELSYSPMTNLELRLRSALQLGKTRTDYGEKQTDYRFELRLRYYFQL